MPPRANPRKVKSHAIYTIPEVAEALEVHQVSVRRWVRDDGLTATTDQRPWLIDGRDLKRFLESRKRAAKRPLGRGEFYCLACRDRRQPDGDLVDYRPRTPAIGMLSGLCPTCGTEMFRAMRRADLERLPLEFEVAFQMAETRISGSAPPTVNVHFEKEPETHGKTQR